jgi:hypothetical protein
LQVAIAALVTAFVYLLHQDFWFWRSARPLVFGFLPIGLFYHAAYTAGISVFMWFMVRRYWPSHLEDANERQRVSHASRAGIEGVPASERVGGSGGAKPPGKK